MAKRKRNYGHGRKQSGFPEPVQLWLLFFLPCFVLLVGSKGFSGISELKTRVFYACSAILAAIVLIRFVVAVCTRKAGRRLAPGGLKLNPAQIAALCYLGFTLLSAALSPYKDAWYSSKDHGNMLSEACYLLVFFAVSCRAKPDKSLKYVFLGTAGVYCLIIAVQLLGGNPLGLYPNGYTYRSLYRLRASYHFAATTGNADLVSVVLCTVVSLCLGITLAERGRRRILPAALAVLSLAELLLIDVLCGVVGLFLGLLVSAFVLARVKPRVRVWALAAAAFLGLGFLGFLWYVPTPIPLFREVHSILHGELSDSFGSGRVEIWRKMLARLDRRQLLFGCGPDTVRLTALEPFRTYDETGTLLRQAAITDAHCWPLQMLYCQGVFALLSFAATVVLALRPWFRSKGRTAAVEILGAALLCFLFAMLFCFTSVIIMPLFWTLLGLLTAAGARREPER